MSNRFAGVKPGDGIWRITVTPEEKKAWAIKYLRSKSNELGRPPHKDEVEEPFRSRIKVFLGPWPRALEAAGLKEPKDKPVKKKRRRWL